MVQKPQRKRRNKNYPRGIMKIGEWKQRAMELLLADDELVKLLKYDTPDALLKDNLTEEERFELIDKSIIGHRYNPKPVSEQKSFITMGLSNWVPQESFRQFSDDYIMGYFYFYILVDVQIMKTDTGYRHDLILSRIYDIFQESRFFGMGELKMETCIDLWEQNNSFGGYTVGFKIMEVK
jgi:hypothetical protein